MTADRRTTQCPRPGCTKRIGRHLFACRGDWFALSVPVRAAIWATVSRPGTRERTDAVETAMEEWSNA